MPDTDYRTRRRQFVIRQVDGRFVVVHRASGRRTVSYKRRDDARLIVGAAMAAVQRGTFDPAEFPYDAHGRTAE